MNTPEQAKEPWCPMVRTSSGSNTGECRVPSYPKCIADKCAMWRWGSMRDPNWKSSSHIEGYVPPKLVRAEVGYCGLAGEDTHHG